MAVISLQDAQELVMLLEAGMQEEADNKFLDLASQHLDKLGKKEDDVYSIVGSLTRDLHDALRHFVDDPRLQKIADVEIPDASERLRSIIMMTDKAATRTLDAVDACSPLAFALNQSIDDLMPIWNRLMHGHIDRFEFVKLCHRVDDLLYKTKEDATTLSNQLNEILIAQDYQDLTGQMIQRVITLVSEVEDRLVTFLVTFSNPETAEKFKEHNSQKTLEESIAPQGPALDSHKQSGEVAASQDEVDDLLASLGF